MCNGFLNNNPNLLKKKVRDLPAIRLPSSGELDLEVLTLNNQFSSDLLTFPTNTNSQID